MFLMRCETSSKKKNNFYIIYMCIHVTKKDFNAWIKYPTAPFVFLRIRYTYEHDRVSPFKICISIAKQNVFIKQRTTLCEVCKKPGYGLCTGCGSVSYCGDEHQQLHWNQVHKNQCKGIREEIIENMKSALRAKMK